MENQDAYGMFHRSAGGKYMEGTNDKYACRTNGNQLGILKYLGPTAGSYDHLVTWRPDRARCVQEIAVSDVAGVGLRESWWSKQKRPSKDSRQTVLCVLRYCVPRGHK